MPVIYDPPPPPAPPPAPPFGSNPYQPLAKNPYTIPLPRHYALELERFHHNEALYRFGEYSMFVLMWNVVDFEQGRVERCSRCWGGSGNQATIADVYDQPLQAKCPVCFGTTFEGGYRALLVRPSIWNITENADRLVQRGPIETSTGTIETTSDFQLHTGDYVFRGSNSRWRVSSLTATWMGEGFEVQVATDNRVAAAANIALEDPSSVAYSIGPGGDELITILNQYNRRWPVDYTDDEAQRSPLIEPYG